MADRVELRQADIFETDFSEATVVVPADRLRILYQWTIPTEILKNLRSSR